MPSKFGGIPVEQPVSKFGGIPVETTAPEIEQLAAPGTGSDIAQAGREALGTIEDIGKVYPVAETAAHLATSIYGVPISGLAGLFALPSGLEEAGKAVEATQKALVYEPQTEAGQRLKTAATYPLAQIEKGAAAAGETVESFGASPEVAAGVHTAISSIPVVLGAKLAASRTPGKAVAKIDSKTSSAVRRGIQKAIRPSVVKKTTHKQAKRYYDQAQVAVEEIIKNKDSLALIDETGKTAKGLPKTLDQFSQAIEQTRRRIFEEYDSLSKAADEGGVAIDLDATAGKLAPIIENKVLRDMSPETIAYAESRIESLTGRKNYTAVETQEAIQLLNQTLEKFYRDPSPEMKGKALVDALIANDLRSQLDSAIRKSTGKEYQALKSKYGAMKAIEGDVTKRAIVDARKNAKGLLDFSDIFTGHHIVRGMLAREPATVAAGGFAKAVSHYYKMLNNPNRIVKKMFAEVEKLGKKRTANK